AARRHIDVFTTRSTGYNEDSASSARPRPSENMSDVFDDIFRQITPERLLLDPRASGAGVPICVIDSGIERSVLEQKFGKDLHPIEGAIFTTDRAEPLPYEGKQSTPHGTTVADIILTQAPAARIYSADVFGPSGTCEVDTVIKALRWAYDVW